MIKKVLTYLTILAITILPIQLISASAETLSMQMSMVQSVLESKECMHEMSGPIVETSIEKSCCSEQSQDCQNCNNYPQAAGSMLPSSLVLSKISILKTTEYLVGHLVLNGVPQQNLLRPPRTQI